MQDAPAGALARRGVARSYREACQRQPIVIGADGTVISRLPNEHPGPL